MRPPDKAGASTVILIHGAWQGSWVWTRLMPLLEDAGLAAIAVDLPGNGHDDTSPEAVSLDLYVQHIEKIVAATKGCVSLVGHSGGGVVATAAAEALAGKVDRVAYIAGMMLPSGMRFAEFLADERAADRGLAGIGPHLVWSPDRQSTAVPTEAAAEIFLSDMAHDAALAALARLTPQPQGGRDVAVRWTDSRFNRLPRLYIECLRDRSVAHELQRRMQELVPGAERVMLDAGHVPHISAPAQLAGALIPFLTRQKRA
ncbi:alpha/beta fold hydrolase [Chelativorans xinjiangense]|uniref:alpha/beta fold hydrolase n=1 Tax=Chelativorans xinjiangense TaxID=2681485 RepID=UPI00135A74E6|nr:alpha/beta fold hydrolase [Chelativorans xinjiangense]